MIRSAMLAYHRLACLGSVLALAVVARAQQIALPGGTGSLTPGPEWTVLGAAELAADERSNDPKTEPARTMLLGMIEGIRNTGRAGACTMLHAPGPTGQPRFVHAYYVAGDTTTAILRGRSFVDGLRQGLAETIAGSGVTMEFLGSEATSLLPVGGVRIRFAASRSDLRWTTDVHVMPAGPASQWFAATHFPDDEGAVAAIERLLASFTGARDGHPTARGGDKFDSIKSTAVVCFGIALAAAFVSLRDRNRGIEAKRRRRRRRVTPNAAGSEPDAG
jgi:hypothetical protein